MLSWYEKYYTWRCGTKGCSNIVSRLEWLTQVNCEARLAPALEPQAEKVFLTMIHKAWVCLAERS